jgi:hypothetical protein
VRSASIMRLIACSPPNCNKPTRFWFQIVYGLSASARC